MHPHGLLHHSTVILILIYFSATDGFLNDKNQRTNVDSNLARERLDRRVGEFTSAERSSVTTKDRHAQNRRTTLGNGNCDGNNNHIKEQSCYRLSRLSETSNPTERITNPGYDPRTLITRKNERYSSDVPENQLRSNANNIRTVMERSSRITGTRNEARRLNFDTNRKSHETRATERRTPENVISARRVTDRHVDTTRAPIDLISRNIDANGNRRRVSSDRATPERSLDNRRRFERNIRSDRIVASEIRMPEQPTSTSIKETPVEISFRVIRSRDAAPNKISVRRNPNTPQTRNEVFGARTDRRSSERRISVANSNSGATIRSSRRSATDVRLASRDATETQLRYRRNPNMQRREARSVEEFGKSDRRYSERRASTIRNDEIEKNRRVPKLKMNENVRDATVRRSLTREVTSRVTRTNERSANVAETRVSSRRNPNTMLTENAEQSTREFGQRSYQRPTVDVSLVNANSDATIRSSRRVMPKPRLVSNDRRDTTAKLSSRRNRNSKQTQRSEKLEERSVANNDRRFSERRVSRRSTIDNEERSTLINRRFSERRFNEVRDANVIGTRRNLDGEDISARVTRNTNTIRTKNEIRATELLGERSHRRSSERQVSVRRNVDREMVKNPSNLSTSSRLVDRTRDVTENQLRRNMNSVQHRRSVRLADRRSEVASDVRSSKMYTQRRTNQSLRSNNEEARRNANEVNAHLDDIAPIYRTTRDVTRRTMQHENIVRKSRLASPIIETNAARNSRDVNKLSGCTERRTAQRRTLDENVHSKQTIIRRLSYDVSANHRQEKTQRMVSGKQQLMVEESNWGNVAKMLLLTVTLVQILGSTDPKKYGFFKLTNFMSYAKQKVL